MIERHPAGRGRWGGASAIVLLAAGVLTATGLALGHVFATDGTTPAPSAPVPAAVVATVTTTPDPAPEAAQTTTAPVAPRALVADPTTTTEETTVANPPTEQTPPTDANGVRVAPSNPNANQDPGKPGAENGVDANGNPVGPSPQVTPGGQVPQGQPPVG